MISSSAAMKILLYNPDNGVTRNFMPHLWMFLLQALTPPSHEVLLIDGNAHHVRKLADTDDAASFVLSSEAGRSLGRPSKAAIGGHDPEGTSHSQPSERRAHRPADRICLDASGVHIL
jgi:hypothetical protein